MIQFIITSKILRNKLRGGFLGYDTKSTGTKSKCKYTVSLSQTLKLLWSKGNRVKGSLSRGGKYLWTINLRVIYLEREKNSYKLTIKTTLIQFKSEQRSWIQISLEIYIWPRSIWKVIQHHCHQGNANQSHNKILSPC